MSIILIASIIKEVTILRWNKMVPAPLYLLFHVNQPEVVVGINAIVPRRRTTVEESVKDAGAKIRCKT